MSGSAGASPSRTIEPPLPGGARGLAVESLLPPGAEVEPVAPPLIVGNAKRVASRVLSPEEKAQRRFWKNVVVFGVSVVALVVVCWLLAR